MEKDEIKRAEYFAGSIIDLITMPGHPSSTRISVGDLPHKGDKRWSALFLKTLAKRAKKITVFYCFYPLRDGYSRTVFSFNDKLPEPEMEEMAKTSSNVTHRIALESRIELINQKQKEDVLRFTGGIWDMKVLAAILRIKCGIQEPEKLRWDEILPIIFAMGHRKTLKKKIGQKTDNTKPKLKGEWSNPMTKSAMMSRVNIYGYKKFNTFGKQYGLHKAGNRQLWQIRLDKMDNNTRQKFEKS